MKKIYKLKQKSDTATILIEESEVMIIESSSKELSYNLQIILRILHNTQHNIHCNHNNSNSEIYSTQINLSPPKYESHILKKLRLIGFEISPQP